MVFQQVAKHIARLGRSGSPSTHCRLVPNEFHLVEPLKERLASKRFAACVVQCTAALWLKTPGWMPWCRDGVNTWTSLSAAWKLTCTSPLTCHTCIYVRMRPSRTRGEYRNGCNLGFSSVWTGVSLPTFQRPFCLHYRPGEGSSEDLWNAGKLVPAYAALQPRRQPSQNKVLHTVILIALFFETHSWKCVCPYD
jgi:hypothetical protein